MSHGEGFDVKRDFRQMCGMNVRRCHQQEWPGFCTEHKGLEQRQGNADETGVSWLLLREPTSSCKLSRLL